MVRIGLAGIGFMGYIHFLAAQKLRGAGVTAISSRDPKKRAGDWRDIHGNFGPPGRQVDLGTIQRYERFEELLGDPDVDLVDICTPTLQHEPMAIAALRAGKHVLVEKPIALTPEAADRMVAASRDAGRLLMVGHVLPFFPDFAFLAESARTGRYGKLLAGQFRRIIARPDWSAAHLDVAQTGGPAIDLHIHDTHFTGLVCGVPKHVFAVGTAEGDAVTYLTTSYLYGPGGPAVTCSSGAICMSGRPFVHGYEIYLEKASLLYDSGGTPLTLLTADGMSSQPALPGSGDALAAFTDEIQTAVDGVSSGKEPALLSGKLARDALVLCHRECESVKTGKAVAVV